ncbi:MAG: sugar ABC transporter substrate-binding protein [Spirochaetales bacterium]|nr:MAG: sugar ABC transporter substrate-binding protein [Spirochaetales bacterium]
MKRFKLITVLLLVLVFLATGAVLFAGGAKEKGTTGTGKEMVEESKTGGTAPAGVYDVFNNYLEMAKKGQPYAGAPGKGKKLGFANIFGTLPFCISVEQDIIKQAKLAGFAESDMIILDNQYDSTIGLKNADIMLSKRPDFFIEFQADAKVNAIVAAKFNAAKIPLLAVDVPIPGAPFMGVNNWGVALTGGKYMAKLIKEQWGGWDKVDMVVLMQMPAGGEVVMLRSDGFAAALVEEFGADAEKKIVRADGGMGQTEQAKAAMDDVLAAHPAGKKIAVTSINEQTMAGVIASLQGAGRWNPADVIVITLGVDELGQSQIREGLSDAGIAFFPEKYGEYIVPAVVTMLQGQAVPHWIYVQNEVITKENIDKYYPKK